MIRLNTSKMSGNYKHINVNVSVSLSDIVYITKENCKILHHTNNLITDYSS